MLAYISVIALSYYNLPVATLYIILFGVTNFFSPKKLYAYQIKCWVAQITCCSNPAISNLYLPLKYKKIMFYTVYISDLVICSASLYILDPKSAIQHKYVALLFDFYVHAFTYYK